MADDIFDDGDVDDADVVEVPATQDRIDLQKYGEFPAPYYLVELLKEITKQQVDSHASKTWVLQDLIALDTRLAEALMPMIYELILIENSYFLTSGGSLDETSPDLFKLRDQIQKKPGQQYETNPNQHGPYSFGRKSDGTRNLDSRQFIELVIRQLKVLPHIERLPTMHLSTNIVGLCYKSGNHVDLKFKSSLFRKAMFEKTNAPEILRENINTLIAGAGLGDEFKVNLLSDGIIRITKSREGA